MRHERQIGLLLYSASYERAMEKLALILDGDPEFHPLPEAALGTPLSFPDAGRICRRVFPYTAVMAARVVEMTADEMRLSRTDEVQEQFWMGAPDE